MNTNKQNLIQMATLRNQVSVLSRALHDAYARLPKKVLLELLGKAISEYKEKRS